MKSVQNPSADNDSTNGIKRYVRDALCGIQRAPDNQFKTVQNRCDTMVVQIGLYSLLEGYNGQQVKRLFLFLCASLLLARVVYVRLHKNMKLRGARNLD